MNRKVTFGDKLNFYTPSEHGEIIATSLKDALEEKLAEVLEGVCIGVQKVYDGKFNMLLREALESFFDADDFTVFLSDDGITLSSDGFLSVEIDWDAIVADNLDLWMNYGDDYVTPEIWIKRLRDTADRIQEAIDNAEL